MALTIKQLEARRQYIGSSEAASVMGLDPFRSASDLWLSKTGKVDDFAGNEATDRGRLLEPVLIDWAEGELRKPILAGEMVVHPNGLMATNFDGLIRCEVSMEYTESVEAKSTVMDEGWGEPGTDEIPDRVLVQVHHGFACLPSLEVCYVPVVMPVYRKFDFRMYRVEKNPELVAAVEAACCDFMETHVRLGIEPSDFRPSLEVLKRMRRQPGKLVPVADELVDAWIVAKAAKSQAEKDCETAQAALLAAIGDGDAAEFSGGMVTYLETVRKGYIVEQTTYRQLRLKKNKGA